MCFVLDFRLSILQIEIVSDESTPASKKPKYDNIQWGLLVEVDGEDEKVTMDLCVSESEAIEELIHSPITDGVKVRI